MTLLEKKMSALDIIFDVVTITIFMLSMNLPVFQQKSTANRKCSSSSSNGADN